MRTEGFFYNLDILNGGLGIGKLQFLIQKSYKKIFSCNFFFQFLVIKALDPYWIRIRIGLQHQTLDPDPEKMNTDPQPCLVLIESGLFLSKCEEHDYVWYKTTKSDEPRTRGPTSAISTSVRLSL